MRITLTTEEIVAIVSAHLNREMGISTNSENSQLDVATDNKVLFYVDTDMATVPKATPKATESKVAPKVTEGETEVTTKVEPTPVIKEEPAPEPEPEVAQATTQVQEETPVTTQANKPKKLFGAIKM